MGAAAPGNADQVEFWNGEVGQRWARNQDRMDRAFRPFTTTLIERAAPRQGERVIDVGCGCGDLSLALADRLGAEGRVLAVDVSRPMLTRADRVSRLRTQQGAPRLTGRRRTRRPGVSPQPRSTC